MGRDHSPNNARASTPLQRRRILHISGDAAAGASASPLHQRADKQNPRPGHRAFADIQRAGRRLEQSPVLVYIEPGRCPTIHRQRLNGCLADLGTVGDTRYLRAMVDVRLPIDRLIATIGHELQHAVEARESNPGVPGHRESFIGAASRPVGANVYETNAAQDVKEAILRDLRRAGPRCHVATGALPPA